MADLSPFLSKMARRTRRRGSSSLIEFPPSVMEKDIVRRPGHSCPRTRVWSLRDERRHHHRWVLPVLRRVRSGILVGSTFRALPTDRRCTTGLSRTTVTGRAAFQPHHPPASFATITRVVRCRFAHHLAPPSLVGTPRRHVVIPRKCSLLSWILLSSLLASPHRGILCSRANARLLNYRSRLTEPIKGRCGRSGCCECCHYCDYCRWKRILRRTCFFLIVNTDVRRGKDRIVEIVRSAMTSLSNKTEDHLVGIIGFKREQSYWRILILCPNWFCRNYFEKRIFVLSYTNTEIILSKLF